MTQITSSFFVDSQILLLQNQTVQTFGFNCQKANKITMKGKEEEKCYAFAVIMPIIIPLCTIETHIPREDIVNGNPPFWIIKVKKVQVFPILLKVIEGQVCNKNQSYFQRQFFKERNSTHSI